MNKIEELIQELCPEGVEYKVLKDIGFIYGGLTGKSKSDFVNGNAKYIAYSNIYSNIEVRTDIDTFVKIKENERQNLVEYGDVLFTASSETPDECGMSSVLTKQILEPLYLNSFSFGFRLNDKDLFLPGFLKYLFRDLEMRRQINKTANGVTRYNISKRLFEKILIPIPPLPIQQEIVNILDNFNKLEEELKAELEARRTQYDFYLNQLMEFEGKVVEWKTLGEIGEFIRGNGLQKKDFTETGVGCIHYGQIYTYYGIYTYDTLSYVSHAFAKKLRKAKKGDLIIAATSETIEDVCKAVTWLGEDEIAISGDAFIFSHNCNPKYISYFFNSASFNKQKVKYTTGAKVIRVSISNLNKILIPIPPLSEQERIVSILDKFDALVNDTTVGLQAEIDARRKQFEYYRNKLLTFAEYE